MYNWKTKKKKKKKSLETWNNNFCKNIINDSSISNAIL